MCEASHEQARATFTILDVGSEACLVDAAVDGNQNVVMRDDTEYRGHPHCASAGHLFRKHPEVQSVARINT